MRAPNFCYALVFFLTACALPQSPSQAVYDAESAYVVVLSLAVQYRNLAPCGTGETAICRKDDLVKKLQDADAIAYRSLLAAQNAVRTPGTSDSVLKLAIASANEAISAYRDIAAGLK